MFGDFIAFAIIFFCYFFKVEYVFLLVIINHPFKTRLYFIFIVNKLEFYLAFI